MATYSVYVIELAEAAWSHPAFRKRNPRRNPGLPCVYVGMTGRPVDVRFQQHRNGYKANRYARDYGVRILPQHCRTGLGHEAAREEEVRTAERLRQGGWAVWQA